MKRFSEMRREKWQSRDYSMMSEEIYSRVPRENGEKGVYMKKARQATGKVA